MKNTTDPLILAMDTSAGRSSVALWQGGELAFLSDETPGQQSRTLVPFIEQALEKAGKTYADCDAIACALGPGGFTSVRVGIATARAIALTSGKPMLGVGSLEVIAHMSEMEGDVAAIIDAHREQFYVQRFRMGGPVPVAVSEPLLADANGLRAVAHGAKRCMDAPDAKGVAALAAAYLKEGRKEFSAEPVYIREPDAKLPA